jgi:hypothetical protein
LQVYDETAHEDIVDDASADDDDEATFFLSLTLPCDVPPSFLSILSIKNFFVIINSEKINTD